MEDDEFVELVADNNQSVQVPKKSLKLIGVPLNDDSISFPKIKYHILVKIGEYLREHANDNVDEMETTNETDNDDSKDDDDEDGENDDDEDKEGKEFNDKEEKIISLKSQDADADDNYFMEYIRNSHGNWDEKWIKGMDIPTLIELCKSANYLYISKLLDLTCQTIADHMKGLDVEGIRKKFNIENDFTPEEEAKIKEEFQWID